MMCCWIYALILLVGFGSCYQPRYRPPNPKHGNVQPHGSEQESARIAAQINKLKDDDEANPWELSGLFEGDILMDPHTDIRNGDLNALRWPNGTVPYFIEEHNFTKQQEFVILKAMKEYHRKTCIRFRPYQKSDTNWVVFRSTNSGCWSSVGMKHGGQTVNLQSSGCVYHGIVIHELLHAVGFWHQQSASDRDKFVRILWENILPGRKGSFKKYNNSTVTDYGIKYDYGSVMHYGATAFSKNNLPTIETLQPYVTIGQRRGFSRKDIMKVNRMYESRCADRGNSESTTESPEFLEQFNAVHQECAESIEGCK